MAPPPKKSGPSLFGLEDDEDFLDTGNDLFGDLSKPPKPKAATMPAAEAEDEEFEAPVKPAASAAPAAAKAAPAKVAGKKSLFAEDDEEEDDLFSDKPAAAPPAVKPAPAAVAAAAPPKLAAALMADEAESAEEAEEEEPAKVRDLPKSKIFISLPLCGFTRCALIFLIDLPFFFTTPAAATKENAGWCYARGFGRLGGVVGCSCRLPEAGRKASLGR